MGVNYGSESACRTLLSFNEQWFERWVELALSSRTIHPNKFDELSRDHGLFVWFNDIVKITGS